MEKIKQTRDFNQIKEKILGYKYLSWSARLMKIGSFGLYVSLLTLTETCLATEHVVEIKPKCGSCHNCPSQLGVMKAPVAVADVVIGNQHAIVALAQSSAELDEDEEKTPQKTALPLHTAVEIELGHTTSANATPSIRVEPGQKLIFKIGGMCCPTEVEALKGALNFLNKRDREVDLNFDLINAKLIVERRNGILPTTEEIIRAVATTGMQATLWNEPVKQAQGKCCLIC